MAGPSDIEWTDATWNPVVGCSMLSAGCSNCYAMRMAARLQAMGSAKYSQTTRQSGGRAVWTGSITLDTASLDTPLKWKKPRRIFVNSMSDLFQDAVPIDFIALVWGIMEKASWHHFQILTKRSERMLDVLSLPQFRVLPNVWVGVSVEDKQVVNRIDHLRATPSAIRFISFEPLLGSIGPVSLANIDWAIVGGESGPKARPIEHKWVDAIHRACKKDGVAFFFKQWGGTNKKSAGRLLHGRTWDEFPTSHIQKDRAAFLAE